MKRIIIITLLLLCCSSVEAKTVKVKAKETKSETAKADTTKVDTTGVKSDIVWFYGGKIAFNTYNYNYSVGANSYSQRTNTFGISPKAGIFYKEKMLFGLSLWYNTQVEGVPAFALSIKELEEYLKKVQNPKTVSNSLTIAPHFRYRLAALWDKRIGIWGEFRPYFSIDWVKSSIFTNTVQVYGYGFRLGPVFTVDITPKFIFETSLDILAIGWQGSCLDQNLEYDYNNTHQVLPVKYQDSDFGFSYGFNANTLFNAIISVGVMKKF